MKCSSKTVQSKPKTFQDKLAAPRLLTMGERNLGVADDSTRAAGWQRDTVVSKATRV